MMEGLDCNVGRSPGKQARDVQKDAAAAAAQRQDGENDEVQMSRDQTRDQAVLAHVHISPVPAPGSDDPLLPTSSIVSLAASNAAALAQVGRTATCGICSSLVASSLVLSCGHMFCGACLFDFLNQKPSCPTCQVSLRAIPVRCLALDGVVEALCRVLTKSELDKYLARVEAGKSVANKLNKMFWWLQPAAIPALTDLHMQNQNMPGGVAAGAPASALSMAMAAGGGPAVGSRVRGNSCGGASGSASSLRHMQARQSLDSHLACAPSLQPAPAMHHQLLPGLLGVSPVGPPAHHQLYEDHSHQHAAYSHGLAMGSHQPPHQAQPQRQSHASYGVPRAPRIAMPQSFGQAVGLQQQQVHGGMQGMEGANLCNMAALGLTHGLQQQHSMHGMAQLPFFEYAPPAQPSPPQQQHCTQQMAEYAQSVQASSQSEQMANLHAQVQLQNLLRSLSISEWS